MITIQLLKCKMEAAGHGGMSGRDNAIKELAEEYSFILKNAKILNILLKFKNKHHIYIIDCQMGSILTLLTKEEI